VRINQRIACWSCSILGMNLFGGKFCTTEDEDKRRCNCDEISAGMCHCERKNFDSLLWAIVTVFQVSLYVLYVAYSIATVSSAPIPR